MPLSPPLTPPRPHHHHRARRDPHRHRRHRSSTELAVTGTPTHPTPTRSAALPRTHRRTRRLVVVRPLPTPTPTNQQLRHRRTFNRLPHNSIRSQCHTATAPPGSTPAATPHPSWRTDKAWALGSRHHDRAVRPAAATSTTATATAEVGRRPLRAVVDPRVRIAGVADVGDVVVVDVAVVVIGAREAR